MISMIINVAKRSSTQDVPHLSFEALFNKTDESGCTVLELAVKGNHVNVVELLLEEDPAYQHGPGSKLESLLPLIYRAMDKEYIDIVKILSKPYDAGGHKGAVALILAIKRRDKVYVSHLLGENKHLASFVDHQGWTPLHHAAYYEFDSILDVIITALKDVGYQFVYEDIITPFHLAVEGGYTSTVIQLMQIWPVSSSEYTAVNKRGQNVLHLAATKNKKEMIQGILKYCPQQYKDKILNEQDDNGDTPLHILVSRGCFIPELMKHNGINTMVKNNKYWTPRDMLYLEDEIIADQVQIKIVLDDVQTDWIMDLSESLVLPSKRQRKDVMFNKATKLLINERDARMKADLESASALHALIKNMQATEEWKDAVGMIVHAYKHWNSEEDASGVKSLFNSTDEFGNTVLQLAMERNNVGVVKLLLEEDPAYQNCRGSKKHGLMRLIYKAIDNEYSTDIVKLLSETYEAGINHDHKGVLTLILAIKRRDKDSVLGLLKGRVYLVTFAEVEGWTPLHYAAYHEFVSILGPLIEAQKDVGYQFEP
ncbi:hypothetical protein ACET3Z_005019 [Daucus carota]